MRNIWGMFVGNLWGWQGQAPFLYSSHFTEQGIPVARYACLHTVFTRLSTAVSHSSFLNFTVVNPTLSPTFHTTYKDNNKVYKVITY